MRGEVRMPFVAGRFYPDDVEKMRAMLAQQLVAGDGPVVRARVVIAPHAGWVYSGSIAGATYARVEVPRRVVILCPNHTGLGVRRSIWMRGEWQMPGGSIPIDENLAMAIRGSAALSDDHGAHLREHAVEVQLPFLRARNPELSIVPVVLAQLSLEECHEVGEGLARAIAACGEEVLIVASTDMSHYVSAETARDLDALALERVTAFDPDGLYDVVTTRDISMCGYIPTTVALIAAKALGAERAELVRYGNSGDAFGDYERVVGYAGAFVV